MKNSNKALLIIGIIGVILWNIMDYLNGYSIVVVLGTFIFYSVLGITTIVGTIYHLLSEGFKINDTLIGAYAFLIFFIPAIFLSDRIIELFKSPAVVKAAMYDDLFSYHLTLRENGSCEATVIGMFGFTQKFHGAYSMKGDTIIFSKIPYDKENFIPERILLDRDQNAIFIVKDEKGDFSREKTWLNHFKLYE